MFNTRSDLGRNAGVIIAWIAVSCVTVLVFSWLLRRRELTTLAGVHVLDDAMSYSHSMHGSRAHSLRSQYSHRQSAHSHSRPRGRRGAGKVVGDEVVAEKLV